jgi:hypothetical protein
MAIRRAIQKNVGAPTSDKVILELFVGQYGESTTEVLLEYRQGQR